MKKKTKALIVVLFITFSCLGLMLGAIYNFMREVASLSERGIANAPDTQDVALYKPLTKEEYQEKSIELMTDFYEKITEFGERYQHCVLIKEEIDAEDSQWFASKATDILDVILSISDLNPPEEYTDADAHLKESMDIFKAYFRAFILGIQRQDLSLINEHIPNLQKAQDLYYYARNIITIDYDFPLESEDGTVSDMLEILNDAAGIDTESVLKNISKDGKELAGMWGYYNEDGTFDTIVVFTEDGGYEGYRRGEYPNRDDFMGGYWSYDYLTQTMRIFITEAYSDGKPHFDYRSEQRYKVEAFTGDELQLKDQDTYETFRFTRKGS